MRFLGSPFQNRDAGKHSPALEVAGWIKGGSIKVDNAHFCRGSLEKALEMRLAIPAFSLTFVYFILGTVG